MHFLIRHKNRNLEYLRTHSHHDLIRFIINLKSLLQYNKTPQHSIGPYGYKYADDGEKVPPQITITFYPDLQLHPANYMYNNSDPPFQSTMGKKKRMISKTKKTSEEQI